MAPAQGWSMPSFWRITGVVQPILWPVTGPSPASLSKRCSRDWIA